MPPVRAVAARLVRSAGAGAAASLVDLAVLAALVSLAGASPRVASVPALLLGNVVMFFAQRRLAFRSRGGRAGREALSFLLVQSGGFLLNALLFELALRVLPAFAAHYVVLRMMTTNAVWLAYSFPLWHLVFRPNAGPLPASAP